MLLSASTATSKAFCSEASPPVSRLRRSRAMCASCRGAQAPGQPMGCGQGMRRTVLGMPSCRAAAAYPQGAHPSNAHCPPSAWPPATSVDEAAGAAAVSAPRPRLCRGRLGSKQLLVRRPRLTGADDSSVRRSATPLRRTMRPNWLSGFSSKKARMKRCGAGGRGACVCVFVCVSEWWWLWW